MKMQDRIEELAEELGSVKAQLKLSRQVTDRIDDEALAISDIEAVVQARLKRKGTYRLDYADGTNTGALARVFVYVAEKHGVTLVQHTSGSSLCVA